MTWRGWPGKCSNAPAPPADTGEDRFEERALWLETTFGGAGRLQGDLTPACAAALTVVLDALGQKAGPEDTRTAAQRRHDAIEEACRRLISGQLIPGRDGQPAAPDRPRRPARPARPLGSRTVLDPGDGRGRPGSVHLTGPAAEAAACDAMLTPWSPGRSTGRPCTTSPPPGSPSTPTTTPPVTATARTRTTARTPPTASTTAAARPTPTARTRATARPPGMATAMPAATATAKTRATATRATTTTATTATPPAATATATAKTPVTAATARPQTAATPPGTATPPAPAMSRGPAPGTPPPRRRPGLRDPRLPASHPATAAGHPPAAWSLDVVSGPGGLASYLRGALLNAPFSTLSQPLDIGRTTRTIPPTCAPPSPSATSTANSRAARQPASVCDVHHLIHWAHDGPTSLRNLVLLLQIPPSDRHPPLGLEHHPPPRRHHHRHRTRRTHPPLPQPTPASRLTSGDQTPRLARPAPPGRCASLAA